MSVWVFVEPDSSGHHLAYVGSVAQMALTRGFDIQLYLPGNVQGPVPAAFAALRSEVRVSRGVLGGRTFDVFRVTWSALRDPASSRVLVLDVDRWIIGLAVAQIISRRRGVLRVLFVRPVQQEPTRMSWLRFKIKTWLAWLIIRSAGSGSVAILAAPGTDWVSRWPDGVVEVKDFNLLPVSPLSKQAAQRLFGVPPGSLVVGLLGVLARRKNPDLLLASLELLAEEQEKQVVLLCVGPDEDCSAAALTSSQVTIILNNRFVSDSEMSSAVRASDVIACLYDNEGSSGMVTTAAAHEVPVVAAGAVGVTSMVRELNAGRVCALDVAEVADAISAIVGCPWRPHQIQSTPASLDHWLTLS